MLLINDVMLCLNRFSSLPNKVDVHNPPAPQT